MQSQTRLAFMCTESQLLIVENQNNSFGERFVTPLINSPINLTVVIGGENGFLSQTL